MEVYTTISLFNNLNFCIAKSRTMLRQEWHMFMKNHTARLSFGLALQCCHCGFLCWYFRKFRCFFFSHNFVCKRSKILSIINSDISLKNGGVTAGVWGCCSGILRKHTARDQLYLLMVQKSCQPLKVGREKSQPINGFYTSLSRVGGFNPFEK